mgnify:CR=1 FL=1|tara:strand:- start:509 stop:2935 length:2427 start_codon:yes stop_codon:yes gene_type:complete
MGILDDIRSGKQQAEEYIDEKARYFLGPHGYNVASGIMRLVPELSDAADVRDYFTYGGQLGEKLKEGQLDSSTFQDALDTTGSGLAMLIPGLSYRTLQEGTRAFSPPDSGSGGGEPLSRGEIVSPTKPVVSDIDPLGFYSKALRSLENIKKDTGTGEEFLSLLKKAGVKDEELKYSGLGSLLKDDKVVKEELIEKARENLKDTRIEEVAKTFDYTIATDFSNSAKKSTADRNAYREIVSNFREIEKNTGQPILGRTDYVGIDNAFKKAVEDGRITNTVSFDQYFGKGNLEKQAKLKSDMQPAVRQEQSYNLAIRNMLGNYYQDPVGIFEDALSGMVIKGSDTFGYSIYRNKQDALSDNPRIASHLNMDPQEDLDFMRANIDAPQDFFELGIATMPGLKALNDDFIFDFDEAEIQLRDFAGGSKLGKSVEFPEYTIMPNNNYREFVLTLPTEGGSRLSNKPLPIYRGHYAENAFAHYRTNDLPLSNGEQALFIEELQSDWAQAGRRKGFRLSGEEFAKAKEEVVTLSRNLKKELNTFEIEVDGRKMPFADWARETAFPSYDDLDRTIVSARIMDEFNQQIRKGSIYKDGKKLETRKEKDSNNRDVITNPKNSAQDIYNELRKNLRSLESNIPKAPFVTDQNNDRNWLAVSLRRILKRAVDEGHEYVSFPTGTSGDFSQNYFAKNNTRNKGLQKFYDEILPNTLKKIVRKLDEDAIIKADDSVYDNIGKSTNYVSDDYAYLENQGNRIFSDATNIRITPKLIEALEKGIPVFAEGGLVGLEHIARNMFRGPQGISAFEQFIAKPQRPMVS